MFEETSIVSSGLDLVFSTVDNSIRPSFHRKIEFFSFQIKTIIEFEIVLITNKNCNLDLVKILWFRNIS